MEILSSGPDKSNGTSQDRHGQPIDHLSHDHHGMDADIDCRLDCYRRSERDPDDGGETQGASYSICEKTDMKSYDENIKEGNGTC